jgi:hypothetical protein
MNRRRFRFFTLFRLGILPILAGFTFALLLPGQSCADGLNVNIVDPSQTALPGQVVLFTGTVTNDTGSDLTATDLFFDFFAYDPSLTPNQLLGVTDFSLPNITTTSTIDLFNIDLSSAIGPGSFPVYFVLQDVNGDQSATGEVTVVTGIATPEPSAISLLATGLAILSTFLVFSGRSQSRRPIS